MKAELLQFSIVVSGDAHNPTILNPDFLAIQGIVPHAWGWEVRQVITTPMMSMVQYVTGVLLQVQPDSLQVATAGPDVHPTRSKIPEIALGYVKTLPHVHYTGLGINFHSALILENPAETIRDQFLRAGPWSTNHKLAGAGIRLLYPLAPTGRLLLSIDGGDVQQRGEDEAPVSKQAMLINANFHRDTTAHPATEEIERYLEGIHGDLNLYEALLSTILSPED